jgi:hypothetical protein
MLTHTAHAHAPLNYHLDFLQHFTTKEHTRLARPATLTAEEHAIHREQLRATQSLLPNYADETKVNLAGLSKKWKKYKHDLIAVFMKRVLAYLNTRYCTEVLETDNERSAIIHIKRETTMDFFLWMNNNYRINAEGSNLQYIRQFQQLYTVATGKYMDRNDVKEVYKVL